MGFTRSRGFDAQANDIWTIGVCLFMLVTGGSPYVNPCASDASFDAILNGRTSQLLVHWKKMDYVNENILQIFGHIFQFEGRRADITLIKKSKWLQPIKKSTANA